MKLRTTVAIATTAAAVSVGALVAVPALAATDASTVHVLHFTASAIRHHSLGKTGGMQVDREVRNHKVVTYDMLTFTSNNGALVTVALNHAFLYGRLSFAKNGDLSGRVTGGAGRLAGISGTISGVPAGKNATAVTVRYHHS